MTAAVASEALGAQSLHALSVAPGYAVELAALGGLAGERLSLGLSGAHNAANALGAAVLVDVDLANVVHDRPLRMWLGT